MRQCCRDTPTLPDITDQDGAKIRHGVAGQVGHEPGGDTAGGELVNDLGFIVDEHRDALPRHTIDVPAVRKLDVESRDTAGGALAAGKQPLWSRELMLLQPV